MSCRNARRGEGGIVSLTAAFVFGAFFIGSVANAGSTWNKDYDAVVLSVIAESTRAIGTDGSYRLMAMVKLLSGDIGPGQVGDKCRYFVDEERKVEIVVNATLSGLERIRSGEAYQLNCVYLTVESKQGPIEQETWYLVLL